MAAQPSPFYTTHPHAQRESLSPPSVDELNDMLRCEWAWFACSMPDAPRTCESVTACAHSCRRDLCRLGPAHPREAEHLVREACKSGTLVPNELTLRTLDKIWAIHEQLHG